MNIFLEGKKIYLRALTKSDVPIWFDWFNDPLVTAHMNKAAFPNTEIGQEKYLEYISESKSDMQLAIVLKKNDLLIGIIGIHKIDWLNRNGDVSIVIGNKQYWGKGIAKEAVALVVRHAFTKMNLTRLSAGMSVLNKGCERSFVNNGFVLEGVKRKHFFCRDAYVDVLMFGLLREEWKRNLKCK